MTETYFVWYKLPQVGGEADADRVADAQLLDDRLVSLVDDHLEAVVARHGVHVGRAAIADLDGARAQVVHDVELVAAVVEAGDVPALDIRCRLLEERVVLRAADHAHVIGEVLGRIDEIELKVAHAQTAVAGDEGVREGRIAGHVVERVLRIEIVRHVRILGHDVKGSGEVRHQLVHVLLGAVVLVELKIADHVRGVGERVTAVICELLYLHAHENKQKSKH